MKNRNQNIVMVPAILEPETGKISVSSPSVHMYRIRKGQNKLNVELKKINQMRIPGSSPQIRFWSNIRLRKTGSGHKIPIKAIAIDL